jgi:alkaline phosphatase
MVYLISPNAGQANLRIKYSIMNDNKKMRGFNQAESRISRTPGAHGPSHPEDLSNSGCTSEQTASFLTRTTTKSDRRLMWLLIGLYPTGEILCRVQCVSLLCKKNNQTLSMSSFKRKFHLAKFLMPILYRGCLVSHKKTFFLPWVLFLSIVLYVPTLAAQLPVKNIIFLVPDGLGLSNVTAARIRLGGVDGDSLAFETLSQIGYQRTHSRNSVVTDSAAAASAWATGHKFVNGEISHHTINGSSPMTILELAQSLGKSTGLVATSTITHATPAAFGAHVPSRKCETEIAKQYISLGIDVLLGGGVSKFRTTSADPCGTSGDMIALAISHGYTYVTTRAEMEAAPNQQKLLGLFSDKGMTAMINRAADSPEPLLKRMTTKALKILGGNPNGFFLMVEGSQIDWANHANSLQYQLRETVAFDSAVKNALNWVRENNAEEDTLIIVVPDHDCGGMAINGPNGSIIRTGGTDIEAAWTSDYHTACDTMIWSQGPYSEYLGAALDNTHLFYIMKAAFLGKEVKHQKPAY